MTENPVDGILTAQGITSRVFDSDANVVGHVNLMDFDGPITTDQWRDEIEGLNGITAVFESSEESYHVWNLSVSSKSSTVFTMLETHCDSKHIHIGWRRDPTYWVLRVGPKSHQNNQNPDGDEDKDVYKSGPKLERLFISRDEHLPPQSRPHFDFLMAYEGMDEPIWMDKIPWAGENIQMDHYLTVVDRLKDGRPA